MNKHRPDLDDGPTNQKDKDRRRTIFISFFFHVSGSISESANDEMTTKLSPFPVSVDPGPTKLSIFISHFSSLHFMDTRLLRQVLKSNLRNESTPSRSQWSSEQLLNRRNIFIFLLYGIHISKCSHQYEDWIIAFPGLDRSPAQFMMSTKSLHFSIHEH